MKNKILGAICLLFYTQLVSAQGGFDMQRAGETIYDNANRLNYVRFNTGYRVDPAQMEEMINTTFLSGGNTAVLYKTEHDAGGFSHYRFRIERGGSVYANKMIIAHTRRGELISINGDLSDPGAPANAFSLSEKQALDAALKKIGAEKYKWENAEETAHMREVMQNPSFSFDPKGEKVIYETNGEPVSAWKFNIYAEKPLYRANVYVNASTGKVIAEENQICSVDVPGTAVTKYSGVQNITCDQNGSVYRLKEASRGLGVETYNLNNGTTYVNTNFTNTSTSWTTTGFDQGATDAHWGAETTYDYYWNQHNRNSIDNAGFRLVSYVHYSTNFTNAFWDGLRMTYGDGSAQSGMSMFATLDICGHEITHGLTSNSSNLTYSYESGALNESFSDIFGTCIENYGRPGNWNWKIGEDMIAGGLRDMSNPGLEGQPDTYQGNNWWTGAGDNGGVHTNSGVGNYWFYLLTAGGTGTNDKSDAYNVSGIGFTAASRIAFRALTVYFTPSTNYANARLLTMQAARDLYGDCSNELIQTANAWYAVGVGPQFISGVVNPDFTANGVNFCSVPATVSFSNITNNGLTYTWDFGDGTTSTSTNAVHSYTAPGTYNVKLRASGCPNVTDSITKNAYITVDVPQMPVVAGAVDCINNNATLFASGNNALLWYSSMSSSVVLNNGASFITPPLLNTTTYYVANTITNTSVFGGMPSNTGGGFLNNNAAYLIFDVTQSSVLNSVVIYANSNGFRLIQLRNSANGILSSINVSLSVGANTVALNFNLNVGTNYRLGLSSSSSSNLYRSTSGVSYPYNIGNAVNIKSSSGGSQNYFYFYNWEITKKGCSSARVPVTVTVMPLPQVSASATSTLVCADDVTVLDGQPFGGTFSGSGVNGSSFSGAGLLPGNHEVTYTYADANGCSNSAKVSFVTEACTGVGEHSGNGAPGFYPNPARSSITLTGQAGSKVSLRVADASGRVVKEADGLTIGESLILDELARGLYLVSISGENGTIVKTAKLIKE